MQKQQRKDVKSLKQTQEEEFVKLQRRLDKIFESQQILFDQVDELIVDPENSLKLDILDKENEDHSIDREIQALETESIDLAWSLEAERAIEESFYDNERELEGVLLLDLECRSTVCRLEFVMEQDEPWAEGLTALPFVIPWSTDGLFHVDAATETVVFYAAREGIKLADAR